MAKIHINNPKQVINGGAKKYYFKVKGLGGPKGDKGDKGDTGSQGPQGPQGNAATVSVGSTTTLPVGQDATVQNVGTLYNAVLNFGIPQGPRGPQGATGATGAKGDKGDQGNPGPQGEKGTNATVYVGTTSTLNPGSQATVYNSGTDSNAVLNFGIPKGEKGDTGPMPTIAQSTGQATDQVMSQKATTDALNTKQATITSSNKLSADLVTDTSTTNKFVTASDITNWNAKQDALTAGTGIDITGTTISTPAIAPEVVAELPATGTEGKLYLTPKAHTTSTATGNPIEATITAQAGQIESFQLDGDTFQQTYTGKNLFVPPESTTSRGVTYTRNNDGSFNISGTATGGESLASIFTDINLQDGDSLTLSSNVAISTGVVYRVEAYNGNSWLVSLISQVTTMPKTITIPSNATRLRYSIGVLENRTVELNNVTFQLENGTATSYEPYVGGQASPSPSYPQQIQTVTGEQTVTVSSKNLFSGQNLTEDSRVSTSNGVTYGREGYDVSDYIKIEPSTNYALTCGNAQNGSYFSWYDSTKTYISGSSWQNKTAKTSPANAAYIRFDFLASEVDIVQFEKGSVSSYVPYLNVSYPLDLGTIELCKLGTYQDYIYKDGSDWKVHKAVAKHALKPNEGWLIPNSASYPNLFQTNAISDLGNLSDAYTAASTSPQAYCEALVYLPGSGDVRTTQGFSLYHTVEGGTAYNIARINIADFTTTTQLNNWLSTCNASFWYGVKNPTDTTITDTNLIAQLEAIRTASLQNGANAISNSATAPNLAGDMEIGYYGFNPTNRYDKWLWLDLNNNYEKLGS